jgi:hypothetical protein
MAYTQHVFRDGALIKKFENFLKEENAKEMSQKKPLRRKVTCIECGKKDMSRVNALHLKRKINSKARRTKGQKKAYVAWDDNKISSCSNEDHANTALMASHHSSNEKHDISDSEIDDSPSYDEL